MIPNKDLLNAAVLNNAEWCNTICGAKGAAGIFDADVWHAGGAPPQYYPNLVTLRADVSTEHIGRFAENSDADFSIKDSFNDLDLTTLSMIKLFEAEWLLAPDVQTSATGYEIVSNDDEIMQWQNAWDKDMPSGFFNASLLKNGDVKFIGIKKNGVYMAGAILNLSKNVVGISNLFYGDDIPGAVNVFLSASQHLFPGLPVVGYSRGNELDDLKSKGWLSLGPLSVWVK
ncbi:hypothetical protein [Mucilaginibacter conchicola]|uniref:hypothetical protein n=1 Tax=Mucilaginibacter conchicola TaxID=2303333 RepID=UPI0011C12697|nr:hypothetical protein [Mucilaginibacter conchicola]